MPRDELPEGADELYDVDPSEFVAARDALAKELRARGEVAAANQVRGLLRPTAAAAALNRVARDEPGLVADLLEAGRQLVAAQAAAVRGDRDALREASRRRRELVRRLTARAADISGLAHREAIAATVEAAAVDPEVADSLAAGRLTRDAPPPSAFDLTGVPDDLPAPPKADPAAEKRRRLADDEVAAAEQAMAEAEQALEAAEEAVIAARHALQDARARRAELQ